MQFSTQITMFSYSLYRLPCSKSLHATVRHVDADLSKHLGVEDMISCFHVFSPVDVVAGCYIMGVRRRSLINIGSYMKSDQMCPWCRKLLQA